MTSTEPLVWCWHDVLRKCNRSCWETSVLSGGATHGFMSLGSQLFYQDNSSRIPFSRQIFPSLPPSLPSSLPQS